MGWESGASGQLQSLQVDEDALNAPEGKATVIATAVLPYASWGSALRPEYVSFGILSRVPDC